MIKPFFKKAVLSISNWPILWRPARQIIDVIYRLVKGLHRRAEKLDACKIAKPVKALDVEGLVSINAVRDVAEVSSMMQKEQVTPFLVPARLSVWGYGFRYSRDEHPWVAWLQKKGGGLEHFYSLYQPKDIFEALCPVSVPEASVDNLSVSVVMQRLPRDPWLYSDRFGIFPKEFRGETENGIRMGKEHGHQHRGPITQAKLNMTAQALEGVYKSLKCNGYRPDIGGWIRGYFLISGSEFLFIICGGQHRAAAWAALGNDYIPVIFQPGFPRIIDVDRLKNAEKNIAMAYFDEEYRAARRRLVTGLSQDSNRN